MLNDTEIRDLLEQFGLDFQSVNKVHDTSRGENDRRFNYILDDRYVLKVNSAHVMSEDRLKEISRLIGRYCDIGVYCPAIIPAKNGALSVSFEKDGAEYACYVEEFARYPILEENAAHDRREVVEHLGVLAAKYTGVDLWETKSMWSIIDLAPLDTDVDEKQENTDMLTEALREIGCPDIADRVNALNEEIRRQIMTVFDRLPRCVYQGDLNDSNELFHDGHFAGLIDFNLSGTDVNINVFLNETNWFPEEEELDSLSVEAIMEKMETEQTDKLSAIFRHYEMNDLERFAFPMYKRIAELFQYPNVCAMVKWLREGSRREKCLSLIRVLVDKPLTD